MKATTLLAKEENQTASNQAIRQKAAARKQKRKSIDSGEVEDPPLHSKKEMLLRYRPVVKIIVAKMRDNLPSHADLEELESVGLIGLISAIDRFDPTRGYTFETYASIRIRGAILDELRNLDMMPRSVRAKQRQLQKTVEQLEQDLGRAPSDEEIRHAMELPEKKYRKLRAQTVNPTVIFLDRAENSEDVNPHEAIPDEEATAVPESLEKKELARLVAHKIKELPEAQRKVLALYFNEEMRLAEIGKIMGLSEARVSQIRTQALLHLRRFCRRMTY